MKYFLQGWGGGFAVLGKSTSCFFPSYVFSVLPLINISYVPLVLGLYIKYEILYSPMNVFCAENM